MVTTCFMVQNMKIFRVKSSEEATCCWRKQTCHYHGMEMIGGLGSGGKRSLGRKAHCTLTVCGRFCLCLFSFFILLFLVSASGNAHAFSDGQRASLVIGQKIFTTNMSSTAADGLKFPEQATFDPSGDMWVSDTGNNRILEFRPPFSDGENSSRVIGQT